MHACQLRPVVLEAIPDQIEGDDGQQAVIANVDEDFELPPDAVRLRVFLLFIIVHVGINTNVRADRDPIAY